MTKLMDLNSLEPYFRSETRNAGEDIFTDGKVFMSNSSSTHIDALVKSTPALRVKLKSSGLSSPLVKANCTCTSAQKGQLCKHIWAVLFAAASKDLEFLESKVEIENSSVESGDDGDGTEADLAKALRNAKQENFKLKMKERQAEYKAAQKEKMKARKAEFKEKNKEREAEFKKRVYEKQKEYAKIRREKIQEERKKKSEKRSGGRNTSESEVVKFPEAVEEALSFFSKNGFEFEFPATEESLVRAKKQLARIFHPDKGGSHDEAVVLNHHFTVLVKFFVGSRAGL